MNHQSLSQRMANGVGSSLQWMVVGKWQDRWYIGIFDGCFQKMWFYQIIIVCQWIVMVWCPWICHRRVHRVKSVCSAGYCAAMESLLGHRTQGSRGGCGELCCCTTARGGGTWKSTKERKLSQTLNVWCTWRIMTLSNYSVTPIYKHLEGEQPHLWGLTNHSC